MSLTLTAPDDSALPTTPITIERGTLSAKVQIKIKNATAFPIAGAKVVLVAEKTPGAGDFSTEGSPATDERMGRFEVTGQDSTATPGQQIVLGQVQPMGHLAAALLPTILAGDWILADVWLEQGTSSANGASFMAKVQIADDERVVPIADGISAFAHGVLPGTDQPESYLISGRATTATATPDDQVHSAAGSWLLAGAVITDASIRDSTLNQNDSAAAALAAGEKYIAVLTQGSANAPTVTKGTKATTPARPTPPASEIILAWVTVLYQAGGTSIIANSDIDSDLTYGRLLVTAPATGLSVTVHAGRAIGGGFMQVHGAKETISGLSASSTNRIWLDIDGMLVKTLTDTPPQPGAHWLANAVTSGTAVTSLVDKRTFISPAGITLGPHAASHMGGADAINPTGIGAADLVHTHVESDITSLVTDLAAKMGKIYQHVEEFTYPTAVTVTVAIASGTVPAVYRLGQRTLASEWTRTGQAFTVTPYAADDTITVDFWSTTP